MTGPLYALGRACVRHRLVVVLVWVVVVVALAAVARGTGQQTSDNLVLPGTDSQDAADVLSKRFPTEANGTNPVTFQAPPGGKLTDSRYKDPAIQKVVSPLAGNGAGQLTQGKTVGFVSLTLKDGASELSVDEAHHIIDVANPAKSAGLKVAAGGYLGQKVSKPSTHVSEVVGIVAAVVIL